MSENNTPQQNNEPVVMRTPEGFETKHHAHLGPILGVLVIMLVLILGGLYLWGSMLSQDIEPAPVTPIVNNEPETPRAEADTQILETLSPSDDLDAISADLGATNLGSLDSDISTIDTELNGALGQ